MDDMTEEEAEDYYCNHGGENCPYYKPYMTDAEIEAENKMIEKMENNAWQVKLYVVYFKYSKGNKSFHSF